jgi:transposase InsO family protein
VARPVPHRRRRRPAGPLQPAPPLTQPDPRACRRRVIELRRRRRWGADHIAHEVGLAPSTVQSILRQAGLGRLDRGDRATNEPRRPRRYQRDRPGELVHVDVKKLAAIPTGGGWRMHGRGAEHGMGRHTRAGYRYIHTAIDDRTRLAYSEILHDEQADTAAAFWARAVLWFSLHGITIERVLTDNGACYRSHAWAASCTTTGVTHKRTRPYRPQTNGKVERFHRILLEEWAYIRDWTSEADRVVGYDRFMHFYNRHRSHGALGWHTPIATLTHLAGDNLPDEHI